MCSILRSLFFVVHLLHRIAVAFHSPIANKRERLEQRKELFHIHQIVMVVFGRASIVSHIRIHWRSAILTPIAAAYARIIPRHLHEPLS